MTQETTNLFDAVLALPAAQRAELAGKLLESLEDDDEQRAIEQAWAEEALDRLKAYDEGKMEAYPLDEVLRKLRQRHKP